MSDNPTEPVQPVPGPLSPPVSRAPEGGWLGKVDIPVVLALGVAVSLVVLTLGVVLGFMTDHAPSEGIVVVLGVVFGVAMGAVAVSMRR